MGSPNFDGSTGAVTRDALDLTTTEALTYCQGLAIQSDLQRAAETIDLVRRDHLENPSTTKEEILTATALAHNAIVLLLSCFGHSKDASFLLKSEDVFKKDDQKAFFKEVLDIRDTYIAHSGLC